MFDIYGNFCRFSASISLDEYGCATYGFIQINYIEAGQPQGVVEMLPDRTFIFDIVGWNRCHLFVGVINNPKVD